VSHAEYIHGTDPSEQARLAGLNYLTNRTFIDFLRVPPRSRVLEVGSGLGLLASEVAEAAEGVQVVGVEISPEQIAAAVQTPRVTYVQGDAHRLDFPAASFDLVYSRYVLEHVADPKQVLSEMRRVARPGARVAVLENDVSTLRIDPPCPTFDAVWQAFIDYQKHIGGDALIGRRLLRLFRSAGFETAELSLQPEVHWHGSPSFREWISNVAGNVKSAQQKLVDDGFCAAERIERALAELSGLCDNPDASSNFAWNRAVAVR
jgi:ubiquinone/menaquinone biosynthesis C-methylase UbiE